MKTPHGNHILDSMPIGIIVTDNNGNIQTVNRCANRLMKIPDNATYDQNIFGLFNDQGIRPDRDLSPDDFTDTSGHRVEKDGKVLEITCAPLVEENDAATGVVFAIRDITDIEKRQALKFEREKQDALGELSARIAHEIRNPLGSIELFASLLKKELRQDTGVHRIDQIIDAANKVETRISNLIISREAFQIPVSYVNIHEILRDILLFSEQMSDQESVFLSARYADIEPFIECNPDIMKQVFLNLIMNALRMMPEGSRLDIITNYLPENHMIEVHFVDQGLPDSKDMRFNIFSHLSPTGENSPGLGLAIVHNIINMQKGLIRMEYLEGCRTALILSFPLAGITASETDSHKKKADEKAKYT